MSDIPYITTFNVPSLVSWSWRTVEEEEEEEEEEVYLFANRITRTSN